MKYIITERQLKLIKEDNIRKIDFEVFNNDWDLLQKFLERRGNPPYIIMGDLDLRNNKTIESLGNLQSVGGDLALSFSKIKSLGDLQSVGGDLNLYNSNIESLGNLVSVGGDLFLYDTNITSLEKLESVGGNLDLAASKIVSLENLKSVGGNLDLEGTPLSAMTTKEEIRNMPNLTIEGEIFL